jgi:hypothetical protein
MAIVANSFDKKREYVGKNQDTDVAQALRRAGYDVGDNKKSMADAITQYQRDNGLNATGIADSSTLDVLFGNERANPDNAVSAMPTATPDMPTAPKPTETPASSPSASNQTQTSGGQSSAPQSDAVKQALDLLKQQEAKKPGDYQSQWQDEIDDYLSRIQNRDPFSYDFNSDALYQQYKDNYIQQGRMAMMDTMGQAAAMTGGYGNSYAQSVGQQAYNQQLNQLNDIMPELYGMAFDRYAYEGQQLEDMYNMYLGREEQDYNRYLDSLNQWQAERDYLTNRYDVERSLSRSSGSGTGSKEPSYRTPSTSDDQYYNKLFASVSNINDLDALAIRMEASGYSPDYIASFYNKYSYDLTNSNALPTGLPTNSTTPTSWEEEEKKRQQKNGGGGGKKSVLDRFTY